MSNQQTVILFQLNLEHKQDDSSGWITVGAYNNYPSKYEFEDKMEEHFGYAIKHPKQDLHYRYFNVPFYKDYI